jgi:hypothetical protein
MVRRLPEIIEDRGSHSYVQALFILGGATFFVAELGGPLI